jgi:PAS domain S-box-containing protein
MSLSFGYSMRVTGLLLLGLVLKYSSGAEISGVSSLSVFTNAQQVLDLGVEGAARAVHPVRLRGVITLPVATVPWFYLQDSTAGLLVIHTNADYHPQAGQFVEVEGRAGPGQFAAHLFDANVRVLGVAPLPEPLRADATRLAAGEEFGRWVILEGRVHDMALHPQQLTLIMRAGNQPFPARMHLEEPMLLPKDWLDAKVQVQGVCWTLTERDNRAAGFQIHSPGTNFLTLLEPGSSNIFSRPLRSSKELRSGSLGSGARVKVKGIITLFKPGRWLFLRDENGPVKARQLEPFLPVGSSSNFVDRSYQTPLQPGDQAEVIGAPMVSVLAPMLVDAEYRRLGGGPPPIPISASVAELLGGSRDGDLVTLRGSLLDRERHESWSTVEDLLRLQAGETIFEASLESDRTNALPPLARNAVLQLNGICTVELGEWKTVRTVRLLLRDAHDAQVLGQPPVWASWRVGRILLIAGILGAAALVWIWLLRGRVQQRTKALSQANELLRTSEGRYRALVENAPEAIVVLDTETGCFVEVNENAVRLFGLSRDLLLKTGPAQLSPPAQPDGRSSAEEARERVEAALAGNGKPFEWVHRRSDGTDFPCEVRVARLPVPGRRLVIGAVIDVTERKLAEGEMAKALAQEKELSNLKGRFVSMVSQ